MKLLRYELMIIVLKGEVQRPYSSLSHYFKNSFDNCILYKIIYAQDLLLLLCYLSKGVDIKFLYAMTISYKLYLR